MHLLGMPHTLGQYNLFFANIFNTLFSEVFLTMSLRIIKMTFPLVLLSFGFYPIHNYCLD